MNEPFISQIAETLLDIGRHAKTGMLHISTASGMRLAFFEDGRLVYFVSDVEQEAMVSYLGGAGRLESITDRMQLEELNRNASRKRSLVSLVVESHMTSEDRLRAWLVEYAYECVARLFDARAGETKMLRGTRATHPLPFEVSVEELILEATRRIGDEDRIREAIGPLDQIVNPAPDAMQRIQTLPLSFYDGLIASQLGDRVAIEELLDMTGLPELDSLRALLALRLVGVLEPFTPPRRLTDSGRLRQREEAKETGVVVTSDAASAAFNLVMSEFAHEEADNRAVTFGEMDGSAPTPVVVPPPKHRRGNSAPLQMPKRPRGDTGRLRLLSSAYIQMGETEAAAGNFPAAVQCFESALAQNPNDLEALLAYARTVSKRANGVQGTEKLLRRAVDAHPSSPLPHIELAKLYRQMNRSAEAEEEIKEIRRIDPAHTSLKDLDDDSSGRGGLLSRFGFKADQKPPVEPPKPVAPPTAATTSRAYRRCRNCNGMVPDGARACRICGATL